MSNREVSTEEYYEAMFEMFGTKGWGFFMELLQVDIEQLENAIWQEADEVQTAFLRKHYQIVKTLTSFAEKTKEDYKLVTQQVQEEMDEEEEDN